jgi:hypothetical protein
MTGACEETPIVVPHDWGLSVVASPISLFVAGHHPGRFGITVERAIAFVAHRNRLLSSKQEKHYRGKYGSKTQTHNKLNSERPRGIRLAQGGSEIGAGMRPSRYHARCANAGDLDGRLHAAFWVSRSQAMAEKKGCTMMARKRNAHSMCGLQARNGGELVVRAAGDRLSLNASMPAAPVVKSIKYCSAGI